ncbi:pyridoxal phosphate-dependent transferase [Bisporella sp. PMI_857]|nr:pyridoxal phosphate-dependent transferase [Bisporella sp. PMI_857]
MRITAKYSFNDDYSEGAHPKIIEALARTNLSQQSGYGDDDFSKDARKAIRELIGADEANIYFTAGGTGANLISIASYLRPHEAIIAVESGHIIGKEGGAIEATGHKILSKPGVDGKLTPEDIQSAFDESSLFAWQPKPKMVFISNATEIGTVYRRSELESIAAICKKLELLLFMDGARLGAALTSFKNDITLKDVYNLTDIFWIGGTKNGALLGEAIVIKDSSFGADFPYHMKQRGALLAKGRVLGIQFNTLFQDDLFFGLARYANSAAAEISSSLVDLGFKLWAETDSNQVFVIFPLALVQEVEKHFNFFIWEHLPDGSLVVRLVTSWATEPLAVKRFCKVVEEWTKRS